MDDSEDVARRYVEALSGANGDAAAELTADDGVIVLPNGGRLEGKAGARAFAAKHAETDGRKQDVVVTAIEERTPGRLLLTLDMSSREVATDELLYTMAVGSLIDVRDGLVTSHRVFPSPGEAQIAAAAD